MIQKKQEQNNYWVWSDKDIGFFGPFDSLWFGGNFFGEEFNLNKTGLSSWKNCAGKYGNNIFIFEEKKSKLEFINKIEILEI